MSKILSRLAAQRKNSWSCLTSNVQWHIFASRGRRSRRGVRGDVGNDEVRARRFQRCLHRQVQGCGCSRPRGEYRAATSGAIVRRRRMLKSMVQTHMLNKANMSARVVCRSLAKLQRRVGGRGVASVEVARNKRSEVSIIKKRRAKRSARATFVSEQSAVKKVDLRELSGEYCQISAEESQKLRASGSLVAPAGGEKRKSKRNNGDSANTGRKSPLQHGNETARSAERAQQAMLEDQYCTTVPLLTRSRTTFCAYQILGAMLGNLLPMSPRRLRT